MPEKPSDGVVLPSALEILWGRRSTGRRGPRAELDVEQIVSTAVGIANAEGLQAVSMARVAQTLGFTTMSLYRHLANKDELLQLMWNASALSAADPKIEGADWRERLMSWALIQRRVIEDNSWIVQLPMATPPMSPSSLAWVELGLEALNDLDVPNHAKIRVIGLISQHALIDARMALDERRGREQAAKSGVETDFGVLVRELADPQTYPHLTRVVNEEPPSRVEPEDPLAEYVFDIGIIMDGLAALAPAEGKLSGPRGTSGRG